MTHTQLCYDCTRRFTLAVDPSLRCARDESDGAAQLDVAADEAIAYAQASRQNVHPLDSKEMILMSFLIPRKTLAEWLDLDQE